MRSAYLAGVLLGLYRAGLTRVDIVVGSSAGACCGANFIAGEPEKSCEILSAHLTSPAFVNYRNVWKLDRHVIDIDFLIDETCTQRVPIDMRKIERAKTDLHIATTDYETGETLYFNNRGDDIREALRASCALPYLYRRPIFLKTSKGFRRCVDGGLSAPIPVQKAIAEGANRIIVVSTREIGYRKSPDPTPLWLHDLFYPNSAIGKILKRRHLDYRETLALMAKPPRGVLIDRIAPQNPLPVSRTTRSRPKVDAAIHEGYRDGQDYVRLFS